MPACEVCGEQEFECHDGLYYCCHCNTQSQNLQQQEEQDYIEGTFLKRLKATSTVEKVSGTEPVDKGRPWTTDEAFQYIIKEQVKALIKKGANPLLEDVVFKFWTTYLSKMGMAFTDEEKTESLANKLHPRSRDKYPGTSDEPLMKNFRYGRVLKRRYGAASDKDRVDPLVLQASLQGEKFYEGDNPMDNEPSESGAEMSSSGGSDDEDDDDDYSDGLAFMFTGKTARQLRKLANEKAIYASWERMKMMSTLAFCYLGLAFTNSTVMPADILRWVRRGELPYYNLEKILPKDMQFSAFDFNTFCYAEEPRRWVFRRLVLRLAMFLEIPELPPVNLGNVISRYIIELNLPGELNGLVLNLLKSKPMNARRKFFAELEGKKTLHFFTDFEAAALAYIVVILKLVFGLDDVTERILSTYGKRLKQIVGSAAPPLFIWDEWVAYTEQKIAIYRNQQMPSSVCDLGGIQDLDSCLEYHKSVRSKQIRYRNTPAATRSRERREALKKPCITLLEHLRALKSSQAISSPYKASEVIDDPLAVLDDSPLKLGTVPSRFSSHTPPQDESQRSETQVKSKSVEQSFSECTLRYITRHPSFLEELDNEGLSDYTANNSCLSSGESGDDDDEDDDGDECHKKISSQKKHKRTIRAAVQGVLGRRRSLKKDQRRLLENLEFDVRAAHEKYVVSLSATSDATHWRHRTYDWLLEVCSRIMEVPKVDIETQIQKIEVAVLLQTDQLKTLGKVFHSQNTLAKYFREGT